MSNSFDKKCYFIEIRHTVNCERMRDLSSPLASTLSAERVGLNTFVTSFGKFFNKKRKDIAVLVHAGSGEEV